MHPLEINFLVNESEPFVKGVNNLFVLLSGSEEAYINAVAAGYSQITDKSKFLTLQIFSA